MKTMIKGVIFDLDGVLLDSMLIWEDLGARYLRKHGLVPEQGLNRVLFSMSMEQGAEYLVGHYPLRLSPSEVLADLRDMLQNFYFYEVAAKEGAEELLRSLAAEDIRITAATSSPREHVTRALARNGLLPFIEKIFTTSETGTSKHEPDIYNRAASFMGTRPSETVVFEDSLYALKTAKAAGYAAFGVFDAHGESDQREMQRVADVYVTQLCGISASDLSLTS
ncbi:MAG: HAD family phosphatase [Eubacteriales bacterium]|nr:HAD family phosphatase [Eubacteriales bacterium]